MLVADTRSAHDADVEMEEAPLSRYATAVASEAYLLNTHGVLYNSTSRTFALALIANGGGQHRDAWNFLRY